ncbi:hypothetical protein [Secundilactobacillus muriivasis]
MSKSVAQNGLKSAPKAFSTESRGFRLYVGSALGADFSFATRVSAWWPESAWLAN